MEDFNMKIKHILKEHDSEESSNEIYARPLLDIHLHSDVSDDYAERGSMTNIFILISIALFVMFMAGVNFTNLSVAYTSARAGEVSLRKLNGAGKRLLLIQFLTESMIMTILAILIGFVLFETLLPGFSRLVNKQLDFIYLEDLPLLFICIGAGLVTGLLSGIYPAWMISRNTPNAFLHNRGSVGRSSSSLRQILIGLQFFISTALIIGMLGVIRQSNFMKNKDLGFEPENVIRIEFADSSMVRILRLQEVLSNNPSIACSSVHDYPVCESDNWTRISWEGSEDSEVIRMNINYIDHNFLDCYQMHLIEGDGFQGPQRGIEAEGNQVIINQAALKRMQIEEPVGKKILYGGDYRGGITGRYATITGIIEDYHFLSVHNEITPIMLRLFNEEQTGQSISIRFSGKEMSLIREDIQKEFLKIFPDQAFDYDFVDEFHNSMYVEEYRISKIIIVIAILANLIACMGLFGLIAYSTSSRTREVGLRKVLGADFVVITRLFSREFIRLAILSNLLSWPVVFFALRSWLQSFPYKVPHSILPYLAALAATIIIAYLSMIYHTYKASKINLADSLRHE